MAKAPVADQRRLLDVLELDTRMLRLRHSAKTLPEIQQITDMEAQHVLDNERFVAAKVKFADLKRALTKAEDDVEQVRTRAARDRERLNSGSGGAKELTALQQEVELLANRQEALEDVELEAMEALESAQEVLDRESGVEAEYESARARLEASRDEALAELEREQSDVEQRRDAMADGVDAALMRLYEQLRQQYGSGAAELTARRCGGCRMEMNPIEISRLRALEEDDIAQCEECSRILVRTGESGL